MQLKLIVVGGLRSGEEVAITVPKFIIGRDRDCHLRCNSDVVSRHHCALIVEPDYVSVIDFSSKNGTFVDGERVVREQQLHTGSLLAVGPLQFLVQFAGAPHGNSVPDRIADQKDRIASNDQGVQPPEEIVDDWSDALDPVQLQSSLEDAKWIKHDDPHLDISAPPSKVTGAEQTERTREQAADSALNQEKSRIADHGESRTAKDTRTAAMDALRKIGKTTHKKT